MENIEFIDRLGKVISLEDGILSVKRKNGKVIMSNSIEKYVLIYFDKKNFSGISVLLFTDNKLPNTVYVCSLPAKKNENLAKLYDQMNSKSQKDIQDSYFKACNYFNGKKSATATSNGTDTNISGLSIDLDNVCRSCPDQIQSIKRVRELTGASLHEAKDAVEKFYKNSYSVNKDSNSFYSSLKNLPGADTFGTKKEIKHLQTILLPGEEVKAVTSGLMDNNTWLLAGTDRRVIFVDRGMIFGTKQLEIPLNRINAISYKIGLMLAKIIIRDGASEMLIDNVQKSSVKPFVDAVNKAMGEHREKTVSDNNKQYQSANGVADELLKFKQLMDMGVLTQQEFDDQKKKLLS